MIADILALRERGKSPSAIAKALRVELDVVKAALRRAEPRRLRTHASLDGSNLTDPYRADRLLRRFSWEDPQ